jgi:hypothetical protein
MVFPLYLTWSRDKWSRPRFFLSLVLAPPPSHWLTYANLYLPHKEKKYLERGRNKGAGSYYGCVSHLQCQQNKRSHLILFDSMVSRN